MGPLFPFLSLLFSQQRPEVNLLRTGRTLYDNSLQPSFDRNIWNRQYPAFIKINSFEQQEDPGLSDNYNPKVARVMTIPILVKSPDVVERKPEILPNNLLNYDILNFNSPLPIYRKPHFQPNSLTNYDYIKINSPVLLDKKSEFPGNNLMNYDILKINSPLPLGKKSDVQPKSLLAYDILNIISPLMDDRRSESFPNALDSPDMLNLLANNVPISPPAIKAHEPRELFEPRGTFNPNVVMVFDNPFVRPSMPLQDPEGFHQVKHTMDPEIEAMRLPEGRALPLTNINSGLLDTLINIDSKSIQPAMAEAREIHEAKNTYNPDIFSQMLNVLPISSQVKSAPEEIEIPGQKAHLLQSLLEPHNIPSTQFMQNPINDFETPLINNPGMFDFPMINLGNSPDVLPMAIPSQAPIVPPLPTTSDSTMLSTSTSTGKPSMNITEITLCENSMITLSCPSGQTLYFVSVFYGRASKAICNPVGSVVSPQAYDTTTCALPSSMTTILNLCENQNTCKITAHNDVFREDPCPGILKYMQMSYYCQ